MGSVHVPRLARRRRAGPRMGRMGLAVTVLAALAGAGMLLRGLGVFPATDPADAYKRTLDDGSWEDTDNRRAQQYTESRGLARDAAQTPERHN